MASSGVETVHRGKTEVLPGEGTLHGYHTSAQSGSLNLCVHPQMTTQNGDQPLNDWQMLTPEWSTIYSGSQMTNPGGEEKLFQGPETPALSEDPVYMGQMGTAYLDENVCPGGKPSAPGEGSRSPHMGGQTPYVDPSRDPAGSFVVESHPGKSSFLSPAVLGWLPQEKSDLQIQSQVSKEDPRAWRPHVCPYQDCEKSYKKAFLLAHHLKTHTGEKPYVCTEPGCSWKFSRSEDLKRHQTKHSGQRPHLCAKCNRSFSRLYYLKQHQKACIRGQASSGI